MSTELVLLEPREAVAYVTLNHPEKRNALSRPLLAALRDRLREASARPETRAIVLRANGPVFSAGHDLKEVAGGSAADLDAIFGLCGEVMQLLPALPQPTIAQVHALATAAGLQLVASCDLAVAAEEASFAAPGVKIGLFCTTPGIPLSRAVPAKKALEMLFTGDPIGAAEAHRLGLVNRVVPGADLEAETFALAAKIAAASPAVVAAGKRAFYRQAALGLADAYAFAQPLMVQAAEAADCKEGVAAFFAKRPPRWPSAAGA